MSKFAGDSFSESMAFLRLSLYNLMSLNAGDHVEANEKTDHGAIHFQILIVVGTR